MLIRGIFHWHAPLTLTSIVSSKSCEESSQRTFGLLGSPFSGATPAQATTKSTAFILWGSFYFSVFNSTWKYPALFVVLESLSGIWRAHDSMTTSKWNYRTRNENPRVHSCHKNQARRDAKIPDSRTGFRRRKAPPPVATRRRGRCRCLLEIPMVTFQAPGYLAPTISDFVRVFMFVYKRRSWYLGSKLAAIPPR